MGSKGPKAFDLNAVWRYELRVIKNKKNGPLKLRKWSHWKKVAKSTTSTIFTANVIRRVEINDEDWIKKTLVTKKSNKQYTKNKWLFNWLLKSKRHFNGRHTLSFDYNGNSAQQRIFEFPTNDLSQSQAVAVGTWQRCLSCLDLVFMGGRVLCSEKFVYRRMPTLWTSSVESWTAQWSALLSCLFVSLDLSRWGSIWVSVVLTITKI